MEKDDEKRRGRPSRNISPQGAFLRPVQAGPVAIFAAGTGRIEYLSAVFALADRSDGKWICDDTWAAGGQGKQIARQGRPPYRICMRNGASAQQRSSKNVPAWQECLWDMRDCSLRLRRGQTLRKETPGRQSLLPARIQSALRARKACGRARQGDERIFNDVRLPNSSLTGGSRRHTGQD